MPDEPTNKDKLLAAMRDGKVLDLSGTDAVEKSARGKWGVDHDISPDWIRDILLNSAGSKPDPHGLRLCNARITGRLDLENITTTVALELSSCVLEGGINARDAQLRFLSLVDCVLTAADDPALDAPRLTAVLVQMATTDITDHSERGAIVLDGAHLDVLTCAGVHITNAHGPALTAENATINHGIALSGGFTATGSGELGTIRLTGAQVSGQLNLCGAQLTNPSGPALHAEGIRVGQGTFLRDLEAFGHGLLGTVRLMRAHLSGQLECDGAMISNDDGDGRSLHGDGLQVDMDLFLRNKFVATGELRLLGAHVGGTLDLTDSSLTNESGSALNADGLKVDQSMRLPATCVITGGSDKVALVLTNVTGGGTLTFRPTLTHLIQNRRMNVDGLTYAGLPKGFEVDEWLERLRHGTPDYAAQPYEQLAAAYRGAGMEPETRRVVMDQRDAQLARTETTPFGRTWGRVTRLTLGYGYQPWRALIGLAAVVAIAVLLSVFLGGAGGLAPPPPSDPTAPVVTRCAVVDRIGVGLDYGTPLLSTGASSVCQATAV
jgi:hypothetical protein